MPPALRSSMIARMRAKYGFDAEICTTDTHVVNTLSMDASNVLGRSTKESALLALLDDAMKKALGNLEEVSVNYARVEMKKFAVWGPNSRERINAVMESVISMARFMVPVLVVIGFLVAGWIITII